MLVVIEKESEGIILLILSKIVWHFTNQIILLSLSLSISFFGIQESFRFQNLEFASVWSNDQAKHNNIKSLAMKPTPRTKDMNEGSVIKSNKCKQCDSAFSKVGSLTRHLKTHSGEKPNKCNQCDFASIQAGHVRRHLKTHNGEKSNKCN